MVPGNRIVDITEVVPIRVKPFLFRRHDFSRELGKVDSLLIHLFEKPWNAQGVPQLEGTMFPREPPFHGAVDILDSVTDGRHLRRHVTEHAEEKTGDETSGRARVVQKDLHPSNGVFIGLQGVQNGEGNLFLWPVGHLVQVENLDPFLRLSIESLARFSPQPSFGNHFFQLVRNTKDFPLRVVLCHLVDIFRHVGDDIQSYHVGRPKGGRLGMPDEFTGQGIHFLDGKAPRLHQPDGQEKGEDPDPVGNKIGGVLGDNDPLTQVFLRELPNPVHDLRCCPLGRDNLQKAHVSRGVEEVGSEETAFEILRHGFPDLVDGNPRGIGGHDGPV